MNPTESAKAQLDAWGRAYEARLRQARQAHADRVRASDALLGLAFAKFADEKPEQVGLAIRAALAGDLSLISFAAETAVLTDANEAVDVPPSHDLFGEAA